MRNIFREGQDALIKMTRLENKKAKVLVLGVEVALALCVVIPILMMSSPLPWYWDLAIIFGTPLLAYGAWYWSGRIDPNEVTDDPLLVVEEALREPQQETSPSVTPVEPTPQSNQPVSSATVEKKSRLRRPIVYTPIAGSVRVRRGLISTLHGDEDIKLALRLHHTMLVPSAVMAVSSFAAIFYVRQQPKSEWYLMVLLTLAFGVIVGFPIYRQIRHFIKITRWKHVIISVAVLGILAVIFRAYLPETIRGVINVVDWLLHVLQLDSLKLETAMWLIFWAALTQLILRTIFWRINPVILTNKRILETRRLISPYFPGVFLESVTDEVPHPYWPLTTVGTLDLETPGQEQGLKEIRWFPLKMLQHVRSGRINP